MILVERGPHDQEAAHDLFTIAGDPSFSAATGTTTEPDPDGGPPRLVHLGGQVHFGSPPSPTQGPGAFVLRALVDLPDLTVIVRGEGPGYEYMPGKQLVLPAGITTPISVRSGKNYILIVYDVTGCLDVDGKPKGYTVIGPGDKQIDNPPDVILFHELVHAYRKATATEKVNKELQVVAEHPGENDYRTWRGLPLRTTGPRAHDGFGHCVVAVPKKNTPIRSGEPPCFVATAAYGSELAGPVQFLRDIRDNILLSSRAGRAFFEEFYAHYNAFSPAIADAMRADSGMNDAVRYALAEPIVRFLELVTTTPEGSLDGVPEPWLSHLRREQKLLDDWTANFEPDDCFCRLTIVEAAQELAVYLRYALRDPSRREAYLTKLEASGRIPLGATGERAEQARAVLADAGRPDAEIDRIVAPPQAPAATPLVEPAGAPNGAERPPQPGGDAPGANMNVDEAPDLPGQNPQKFLYTVTLRNNTHLLGDPTDPNASLVPITLDFRMFYKRVNLDGVVFYEVLGVQPGQIAVFPMGACEKMESYAFGAWGYFDAGTGGPLDYEMVWSSLDMTLGGEPIGDITPAKAGAYAAEIGVADTEDCADSYQIRS